jgi:hypothetical protein
MEASSQATCQATTKQGNPCRKPAGEGGFCLFHSGKLDLAEFGRRGGQARGRKQEQDDEETQADRLTRAAWKALEELLESGVAPTAKVRAVGETLDRLEPLIGRTSKAAAVGQAKAELADEWHAATVSAREKLRDLLATRAPGVRSRGGKTAVSEEWAAQVGQALAELDRVVVDRSGQEPIVVQREPTGEEIKARIQGLVDLGLLGWPAEWHKFQARVEERARELTQDAERRAVEAEARLAEFTAGPA